MTIVLGIDTGGTYTDAALVDHDSGEVLFSAKALTTRRDLAIGISQAIDAVFHRPAGAPLFPQPADVEMVSLSTTLATNAIVEGQGSPICLILIGYDPDLIEQYSFQDELVTENIVYVAGGHDIHGDEVAPLDEAALREAVLRYRPEVEAFAVSGYFGVRNPAHELRAREIIEELTGLSVTCGHMLTSRLDSIRRATTVALNARLVPLLQELIHTLRHILTERSIHAPLMVVKGDGSLVRAEWAMQRPIETILSGPAASAVGAWQLAHRNGETEPSLANGDLWVVDVGGTTTDIAGLREGRPYLNPLGAQVGRWRTMVEAIDVYTVGLGGDSHVRLDGARHLAIGPRRVVPLSLLALEHPEVMAELASQATVPPRHELAAQFILARRTPTRTLRGDEQFILERLTKGPTPLTYLTQQFRLGAMVLQHVEGLVAERLALQAGFTPTDALHALGRLELWNSEAARLGAEILAKICRISVQELCQAVIEGVSQQAAQALVTKVLSDEQQPPRWEEEPTAQRLLDRALSENHNSDLSLAFTLRRPVVAIGAPVQAYMPRVAEKLNTHLLIPPHAEVANAVGAVTGGVVQRYQVLIAPQQEADTLRVHLPQGVKDLANLDDAVAYAETQMIPWLKNQAHDAGAAQVEIQVNRVDQNVAVSSGWGGQIYLGTELTFTAIGRPSPAVLAQKG